MGRLWTLEQQRLIRASAGFDLRGITGLRQFSPSSTDLLCLLPAHSLTRCGRASSALNVIKPTRKGRVSYHIMISEVPQRAEDTDVSERASRRDAKGKVPIDEDREKQEFLKNVDSLVRAGMVT